MSQSLVTQVAPTFVATAVKGQDFVELDLASYRGKWVVLFFYPLDFTFVCPTEIIAFSDEVESFKKLNAEVIGVSVDSKYSHLAWVNTPRSQGGLGEIRFPLVADLSKQISRDYGLLFDGQKALRGLFVIDPEGSVAYETVHNLDVGRSTAETLRVIQALQYVREHGEVCPANWRPGADTMKDNPSGSQEYFKKHG